MVELTIGRLPWSHHVGCVSEMSEQCKIPAIFLMVSDVFLCPCLMIWLNYRETTAWLLRQWLKLNFTKRGEASVKKLSL